MALLAYESRRSACLAMGSLPRALMGCFSGILDFTFWIFRLEDVSVL